VDGAVCPQFFAPSTQPWRFDSQPCPSRAQHQKRSNYGRLRHPTSRFMVVYGILRIVMSIPNVKRYRITSPDGTTTASLMAVLPKSVDVNQYLSEAAQRFDWKAYQEAQAKQFKVRVGQQKQKKAK
jgi:hypothetical protein